MLKPLISVLALSAMLLSGCAAPGSFISDAEDTFIYGSTETPRVLNPAVQSGMATATTGAQLFASPIRFTDDFKPKPYLAKSWETSADGLHMTLHLVDDAKFHDGTPVTAEDVAYSLGVVKREHPFGQNLFGPVTSVDTPDEHTVIINLSRRHPALLTAMSPPFLPVIPKHVYDTDDTVTDHPQNNHDVVGSGPYHLVSHTEGKRIVLEKVNDYFMPDDEAPHRVVIEIAKDESTLSLSLQKGEIDMMTVNTPSTQTRMNSIKGVQVADHGYEGIGALGWVGFNLENKFLSKKKVRHAIAYSVDFDYIINSLHKGRMERATGPIANGSPFYNPNLPTYDRDLDRAGELLDEAGFPADADGKRFELGLDFAPLSNEMGNSVAETIRANLAEVGIQVNLRKSADAPTWGARVANFDYDMTLDNVWNWGDPVIGVERTYLCSNIKKGVLWANMSQYCNEEVDSLFQQAASAPDDKTRKKLYFEIQEIIAEELPILPLESHQFRNIYTDRVHNPPNGVFGIMSPLLDISVEG